MVPAMSTNASERHPTACFSVTAAHEPSVLSRILELFAKRGVVPTRLHSDVAGTGDAPLSVDIQVEGMEPELAAYIARCMRQIAYVDCVLTSERGAANALRA